MIIHCHDDDKWMYTEGWNSPPIVVPSVVFHTRVRDETIDSPNPYRWEQKTTFDYFAGKRVVVFSLPGAFTPTCSTYQLPGFEALYPTFKHRGIDEIYCISVNDAFVMNKWAIDQNIKDVKLICDGNADFTRGMKMDVQKENLGFGIRSWRYAMVVNNGLIESMFIETGKEDNHEEDPYEYTIPALILDTL